MTATEPAQEPAQQPPAPERLALAEGFAPVTREEWVAAVDAVGRKARLVGEDAPAGAAVQALTRTTPEGVEVPPLLTAEDVAGLAPTGDPGAFPFTRGAHAVPRPDGWDVRQRHAGTDPAALREAVLADLECGVTSVWLAVGEGSVRVEDLPQVLEGVLLDLAPVALDAGADEVAAAEAFLALAAERGVADDDLLGSLGLDPVGRRAREGAGTGADLDAAAGLAARVAGSHPRLTAITVDATPVREAGGSDAQQLGFSLAAGVAYLRALTAVGLDIDTTARTLEFRYAVSVQQLPTIAMLRAARRTWARVLEACGSTDVPQRQHAVLPETLLTRRDPWVNMLRGTVAAFSAGVGGADSVTVPPFDAAVGVPQPFSRRIARNTQVLLMEESHVARVVDPAGGSYAVEHLTDRLANAAWEFFQQLEREGRAVAALDSGFVADAVTTVRERRERDVATRATPLTGVSEFADVDEKPLVREPLVATGRGGLPLYRPAAPFEGLRDRADAARDRDGARPAAFLATLGPLPVHAARAGFTRNLLRAGGIDAVEAGATETTDDVLRTFDPATTPVAVVCSSDQLYAERAAQTVAALRAAGARLVLLAGRPRDRAGVADAPDGHLYAGCDAVAVLDLVHRTLEVAE